jgi:quercetin dioxygenase-like cupin family protein
MARGAGGAPPDSGKTARSPIAAECEQGENNMNRKIRIAAVVALVALAGIAGSQQPAPSGIKRTILQRVDVPGSNFETVTGIAELAPNVNAGRHTHPGPETGLFLEGEAVLLVDGRPPQNVKAGDSYQIAMGAVHDVKSGDKGVKVMAVYVVEKGKPLASPAP